MSPNVPLRYGLSTIDGYDGGVLPLQRYLQIASLLVPRNEIRADGVLRTRLIAIPDERLLRLFNVRSVIANEVSDVELGGFKFDVATARSLESGQTVHVDLSEPVNVEALAILNSATADQGSQTDVGTIRLIRNDGSTDELPLTYGEDVFHEMGPGRLNAFQPTAGLNRGGRTDTATVNRFDETGSPVQAIEWTWTGRGPWNLRAATILASDGSQRQLLLQPGLTKRSFSPVKVYERAAPSPDRVRLVPRATLADDEAALNVLRSSAPDDSVVLATDQSGSVQGNGDGVFRRGATSPEHRVFDRVEGRGGGYLVVDDAWFPGWRAQIDGVEAPVLRADVYFKAVWVPDGAQRVELWYEPRSLRFGALLSLGALAVIAILLVRGRLWR